MPEGLRIAESVDGWISCRGQVTVRDAEFRHNQELDSKDS